MEKANLLTEVEWKFNKYLIIRDWQGFRLVLATAVAHYLLGEMIWLRIIGASGAGKTELLRSLENAPNSVIMEAVTPAAIRGGLIGGNRLLTRIDRQRVITKDMASIRTMRNDARRELFGVLRGVQDGSLDSDFGTREGHIHQSAKFDWLLATTPEPESQRQIESILGERFVDLRWLSADRVKTAKRASYNNLRMRYIRKELSEVVSSLLTEAKELVKSSPPKLERESVEAIAKWADATALSRSSVQWNPYLKVIEFMPAPEVGTRLAQSFSRIARAIILLGIEDPMPYIARLVWDCIPSVRAVLLKQLQNGPQTTKALSQAVRLPESTALHYLKELELLRVVRERSGVYKLKIGLPKAPTTVATRLKRHPAPSVITPDSKGRLAIDLDNIK